MNKGHILPATHSSTSTSGQVDVLELGLLEKLEMPGLTTKLCGFLSECAAASLQTCGHTSGVLLNTAGVTEKIVRLIWETLPESSFAAYADSSEATEYGACGISILIVHNTLGLQVVERSRISTGFDYYLAYPENSETWFSETSWLKLEVSGIHQGTVSKIRKRVNEKKKQIARSFEMSSGVVSVVEFSSPVIWVVQA